MPIHLADKNSSVLMAYPPGNRHKVYSAHHGVADEMVTAIMETKLLKVIGQHIFFVFELWTLALRTRFRRLVAERDLFAVVTDATRNSSCQQKGFPKSLGAVVFIPSLRTGKHPLRIRRAAGVHGLEMGFQFSVEVHAPGLPVFCVRVRADGEQLMFKIHIIPPELDGFLLAGTAPRQQPDVIGELHTVLCGSQDCPAKQVNVFAGVETAGFLLNPLLLYSVHRQGLDEAVHSRALENVP
jgi:hypothetical protein